MRRLRLLLRLFAIERTLLRYGLDEIVLRTHLFRPFAALRKLLFFRGKASRGPLGERIRLALEELGPLFVKFGQAVSVRRDLLPREIADELAKLQDEVPPFPGEDVVAILERAFGRKVDETFAEFDTTALAAASIAQAHAAKLSGGQEVVVKVLETRCPRDDPPRSRGAVRARRTCRAVLAGGAAPASAGSRGRVREDARA